MSYPLTLRLLPASWDLTDRLWTAWAEKQPHDWMSPLVSETTRHIVAAHELGYGAIEHTVIPNPHNPTGKPWVVVKGRLKESEPRLVDDFLDENQLIGEIEERTGSEPRSWTREYEHEKERVRRTWISPSDRQNNETHQRAAFGSLELEVQLSAFLNIVHRHRMPRVPRDADPTLFNDFVDGRREAAEWEEFGRYEESGKIARFHAEFRIDDEVVPDTRRPVRMMYDQKPTQSVVFLDRVVCRNWLIADGYVVLTRVDYERARGLSLAIEFNQQGDRVYRYPMKKQIDLLDDRGNPEPSQP